MRSVLGTRRIPIALIRKPALTLVSAWLLALVTSSAQATDWYVNAITGNNGNNGLTAATAFKTIQTGINAAAASGDTVHVAGGVYAEHLTWASKDLQLLGAGKDSTFLDGANSGAILFFTASVPATARIDGFTFINGRSPGGGAILGGAPTVTNCTFTNNTAFLIGAGTGIGGASLGASTFINCTFLNNTATVNGSALSGGTAINCVFSGNGANVLSGSTVVNSILWGNAGAIGSGTITFSDVQGGFAGAGNINADPLFVNAGAGNFHLSVGSPCINAGSNAAVPAGITTDADGANRFKGSAVDMGPYESNTKPATSPGTFDVPQDIQTPFYFSAGDSDGDPLTVIITANPSHGTVSGSGEVRSYTPNAGYFGPDSLKFKVNDGIDDSNESTISFNIIGKPTANSQSVKITNPNGQDITLTGSDPNSPPRSLTFEVDGTGPLNGTVSIAGSVATYTPNAGYTGPDSFQFKANNGVAASSPATVSLVVNRPPSTTNGSFEIPQDVQTTFHFTAGDEDGNPLTYIITANPSHGTVSGSGEVRSYTPNAGYFGPDSLKFKVNDGIDDSNESTISFNIIGKPTANSQSVSVNQDTARAITLTGSDPNSPPRSLTYTVTSNPAHGLLSGTAPNLTYTPNPGYTGPDSFQFKVSNTAHNTVQDSNVATVGINVAPSVAPTVVSFKVLFGSSSYDLAGGRSILPWTITGIQVKFSKPIASATASSLTGLSATGLSGLGTDTLTWTVGPLTNGSFSTSLLGTGPNAIKDSAGNPISGYSKSFKVLYGDFNGDGYVTSADMSGVYGATAQPYNILADINGNGVIDITDVNIVRARLGAKL